MRDSILLGADYAFIEDSYFRTLTKEEQIFILQNEVYNQMKEPAPITKDYKKKRKDFWNELPKPKRRKK